MKINIIWLVAYSIEHLRNKTCSLCLNSLVKSVSNIWENSRADWWKPEMQSRVFTSSRFAPGDEGMENMYYFFYKIVIFHFKKRKIIYEVCMYTLILSWNCNFSQLEILLTSFSCFIVLWENTVLYTNQNKYVLSKLFYKNIFKNRVISSVLVVNDLWNNNTILIVNSDKRQTVISYFFLIIFQCLSMLCIRWLA